MTDIPVERRANARLVKADVEAIFGAAPRADARPSIKVRAMGAAAPKRPSRAAGIGASVALGLAGIAVGALLTKTPPPPPAAVQPATTPPALEVVLAPEPVAAPATVAPQSAPAAVADKPKASPKALEKAKPETRGDCSARGGQRCSYSTVLAADRTLRRAYERAARAGVSRAELATYRRSWSRLRPAGARDPDRVVRGYRAMAADLNRLARDSRG